METWKFLYTKYKTIKQACTKTGAPKEGNASRMSFVITKGINYSECLVKAKRECKFSDAQLMGSTKIKSKLHICDRLKAMSTEQLCKIMDFLSMRDSKMFLLSFDIQYVFNEVYYLIEERKGNK